MQQLIFQNREAESAEYKVFKTVELGKKHEGINWPELTSAIQRLLPKKIKAGRSEYLSLQGQIGLLLLQHYSGLSDRKLMEHFRANWEWQLFCGKRHNIFQKMPDANLLSRLRKKFADPSVLKCMQAVLLGQWKEAINNPQILLMDATCYEVNMRYPTDQKLLWECCQWLHKQIVTQCQVLKIKRPRNKYNDQVVKQQAYAKQRKKGYKLNRKRIKSLLYLLKKLQGSYKIYLAKVRLYYGLEN